MTYTDISVLCGDSARLKGRGPCTWHGLAPGHCLASLQTSLCWRDERNWAVTSWLWVVWGPPRSPSGWPVLPSGGRLCPWSGCRVDRVHGLRGVGLGFLPAPSSLGQSCLLCTHQWSMPLTSLGRASPPLAGVASLLLILLPRLGIMRTTEATRPCERLW